MSRYFQYFPKIKYGDETVTDITKRVKVVKKLERSPYAMLPYTIKDGETAEEVAYYYYGDAAYSWLLYHANNIIDPYTQWPLSSDALIKSFNAKYAYARTIDVSDVTAVNNTITLTQHKYKTTDPVTLTSTSTLIGGLTESTTYYVIVVDYNTIKLATTIQNALDGIEINLTNRGSGDHRIARNLSVYRDSTMIEANIAYVENIEDPSIRINYDSYKNLDYIADQWNVIRFFEYENIKNENLRNIQVVDLKYIKQIERDLERLMNE